jgi:hypothetical protein
MAQEVSDLVDGTSLANQLRCEAVTHQVGAGDPGKLETTSFQP